MNVKLEFFHGRLIGGFEQIANEEGKTFDDMPVVHAQLEQVDELEETERGDHGFGSTGK